MSKYVAPKVIIAMDIESLGLGPRALVTSVGIISASVNDPLTPVREIHDFYPMQPQLELIQPRTVQAGTFAFWLKQGEEARLKLAEGLDGDMDTLRAMVRHTIREFGFMIAGLNKGEYEVWARGPQFDVAAMETLIRELGEEVPWAYDSVRDLRTIMARAAITVDDVTKPEELIQHNALDDARYQMLCYVEANRLISAR